ncbi:MAG: hypothetical protein ISN28_14305 [Ectothiorhodospiraceae bacterium AqS1]|nr:hypothetical protein [Ectothiorhodospiraceae bacterium AqS1]
MKVATSARILGAVMATVLLAGCWDSTEVVLHRPGEYKGESDPLLDQSTTTRIETLNDRFQTGQMDR